MATSRVKKRTETFKKIAIDWSVYALVQKEVHLLKLSRYVVFNPVWAGMLDCLKFGRGNRNETLVAAYPSGTYSMAEIANYFDVLYMLMSRAVRAAVEK